MDPTWMLRSLADRTRVDGEVNGLLVDLRDMPREVQEIAFAKGMIPYIPTAQEWLDGGPGIHGSTKSAGLASSNDRGNGLRSIRLRWDMEPDNRAATER